MLAQSSQDRHYSILISAESLTKHLLGLALRLWPGAPSFSNQVLRYWRMPAGLDRDIGLPVHRAMPDAYVTAFHLRDMLAEASPEQLVAWSAEPGLLPRVPAGPDRGKAWAELDTDALRRFASDRDEDVRFSAGTELARRETGGCRETGPQLGLLL